jgi:hypothetical protein
MRRRFNQVQHPQLSHPEATSPLPSLPPETRQPTPETHSRGNRGRPARNDWLPKVKIAVEGIPIQSYVDEQGMCVVPLRTKTNQSLVHYANKGLEKGLQSPVRSVPERHVRCLMWKSPGRWDASCVGREDSRAAGRHSRLDVHKGRLSRILLFLHLHLLPLFLLLH